MLLFCDGFDSYAATADFTKKWTNNNNGCWSYGATAGVLGGPGATTNVGDNNYFFEKFLPFSTGSGRMSISYWFKAAASTNFLNFLAMYKDGNFSFAIRIRNGSLNWTNGWNDVNFTHLSISDGAWHHLEFSWLQTNVSNTDNIRIWIDGVLAISSNYNPVYYTANSAPNRVLLYGQPTSSIDDFVWWDDVPGDNFISSTTPLGVQYIETIRPNAAGSLTGLTATGAASNWSAVNDVTHNGDTSYVSGLTGTDLYNYSNLTSNPSTINGVVVTSTVRVGGIGTSNFATKIKSGATTIGSTPVTLTSQGYRMFQTARALDPNTGSAWTKTAVDALEAGVEIT